MEHVEAKPALHAGLVCVGDEGAGRLHVDFVGELGIERARGVADDRREVHDGVGARQRAFARLSVADVRADHLDARLLLLGGDVLLAVQQRVEHADLALRLAQLLHEQRADVAAAAGDQRRLTHLMVLSVVVPGSRVAARMAFPAGRSPDAAEPQSYSAIGTPRGRLSAAAHRRAHDDRPRPERAGAVRNTVRLAPEHGAPMSTH